MAEKPSPQFHRDAFWCFCTIRSAFLWSKWVRRLQGEQWSNWIKFGCHLVLDIFGILRCKNDKEKDPVYGQWLSKWDLDLNFNEFDMIDILKSVPWLAWQSHWLWHGKLCSFLCRMQILGQKSCMFVWCQSQYKVVQPSNASHEVAFPPTIEWSNWW